MADMEKLLDGLHCRATNFPEKDCAHCYYGIQMGRRWGCDFRRMTEDALAMLEVREPRVMTLEEVKRLDSDCYYLESMRSPGKELREVVGAYGLTCVTWPSITWARQTMGDSGYGKTWRCWTARPTDEQREAVKWE